MRWIDVSPTDSVSRDYRSAGDLERLQVFGGPDTAPPNQPLWRLFHFRKVVAHFRHLQDAKSYAEIHYPQGHR